MAVKFAAWESELWSLLASGDSLRCPLYNYCTARLAGNYCLDDHQEIIRQALYGKVAVHNRSTSGINKPTGRMCHLVDTLAEKYIVSGYDIHPPASEKIAGLADPGHPVEVRSVSFHVIHGVIWYLDGAWVVQINRNDNPQIRRLTLFHEVFHIMERSSPWYFPRNMANDGMSFREMLADYFAMCVLMPVNLVRAKWFKLNSVDMMARTFKVAPSVMDVRLKILGLI